MSLATTGRAIVSAESMLRQFERDVLCSKDLMPYGWPPERMPESAQLNIVRSTAVAKHWRSEGRQTLAMHPEVVRAVSGASSSKFDMSMLRAIPYINPMVVFDQPPVIESWRRGAGPERWMAYTGEHEMRLIGFVLSGKRASGRLRPNSSFPDLIQAVIDEVTSTHDPAALALSVIAYFEVYDDAGKKIDGELSTLSMPLDGTYTLKELVADQARRYNFGGYASSASEEKTKWFREVYKIVMGVVLYLCSTVLDAERVPASATRHLSKTIARKPLSLYRVGWTLGAALTRYRQSIPKGSGSQMGDIRHQQDPQHRKCHFRWQWYGPRNAAPCDLVRGACDCPLRHREWIFIAPYWTHRERLGVAGMNTLRKVPRAV